jgi:signal transduction histidine kinase
MIRFNEAIDQALVESIAAYGTAVEATRKMVLAVLGHDLRSPLGAILMAGGLIQRQPGLDEKGKRLATQVCTSAHRANVMINDLLDLARCNLGTGNSCGYAENGFECNLPGCHRRAAHGVPARADHPG